MSGDVRLATPPSDEAPRIAALMRRCFTETFGHLYRPADLAAFLGTQSDANWQAELADPALSVQVAYAGEDPVGLAKIGPIALPVSPNGSAVELRQFYLLGDRQGTGLAQRLMAWVLDEARRRSAGELFLSVYVDNHRARRFYERLGFERVGAYTFMVGAQADEDDLMRLVL